MNRTQPHRTGAHNIAYRTDGIAEYFEATRMTWEQLYPSERWIFERLASKTGALSSILDVGCAAGGLGLALQERFPIERYVGVDINEQVIALARSRAERFKMPTDFRCGDILALEQAIVGPFDLVANLSCADWNVEANAIIDASWKHVAVGGSLVISLRLTDRPGVNDITKSYQPILGGESATGELANYVVFNVHDALRLFRELNPSASRVLAYGYWGTPSKSAVTPYERLAFAVFAVTKGGLEPGDVASELHLPLSLLV